MELSVDDRCLYIQRHPPQRSTAQYGEVEATSSESEMGDHGAICARDCPLYCYDTIFGCIQGQKRGQCHARSDQGEEQVGSGPYVEFGRLRINAFVRPELIDLRYGFYVAMGGFVYDVENLREDLSLVTLTPRGIITLAKQGQFVDISTEDITDKSKADIFTKSLICIQVSWMAIQCIARKAAGYPLTLLEIHTMVHVVCALVLYLLWWKVSPLQLIIGSAQHD